MLAQVVYAGANAPSFARAAQDLRHLAGRDVAVKQVERLTRQVGAERVAERTAEVEAWRGRPLSDKHPLPEGVAPSGKGFLSISGRPRQASTSAVRSATRSAPTCRVKRSTCLTWMT